MCKNIFRFCLTLCLCMSFLCITANAELSRNYESIRTEYGERADSYTTQTFLGDKPVNVVYASPENATLFTLTYIRQGPSMETPHIGLVDVGDIVKVWGFTDNGWDKMYFKSADGTNYFGYIKGDLLITPPEDGNIEVPDGVVLDNGSGNAG